MVSSTQLLPWWLVGEKLSTKPFRSTRPIEPMACRIDSRVGFGPAFFSAITRVLAAMHDSSDV